MLLKHQSICLTVGILSLCAGIVGVQANNTYECEGVFRAGYECWKAVDGDWMTSAVPDAYGDSVAVIEDHAIPLGVSAAKWRFKVLRNTADIGIKAYYWNYVTSAWSLLYEVPVSLDYTTYTVNVPNSGLLSSSLRTRMWVKNASSPLMSGEYLEGVVDWIYAEPGHACEGVFRAGYECSKAVDGDWMTSADPDAYGDSVAVIEDHAIPLGVSAAKWRFKVLRNTTDIGIKAYYWNYVTNAWSLLYEVPVSLDYTTYTRDVPDSGLLSSPLRTRMWVKNAFGMSGEYFEGVVDWIYASPSYGCEGTFRAGYECSKAVDGDWMTCAVPDAYGDSVAVIEDHAIPLGVSAARWQFKVLRNTADIGIKAYYWNYVTGAWSLLYVVPESLNDTTYTVDVPDSGLLSSPLKTRMWVKNAFGMSGEYFEGAVDWIYAEPGYACEGIFRAGYECSKAVDGDWMTSADPDAYGDSVAVIEEYPIPLGTCHAWWQFKVLRNTAGIEIKAYYWNYVTSAWSLLYEVPVSLDYTTYTVNVPGSGLLSSPLRTRMWVKNAGAMSGEYFEGVVDWSYDGDADGFDDPCDSCPAVTNPVQALRVAMTGDVNTNGSITSADIIYLVNYVFKGGALPMPCIPSGDVNCSGTVTSSDIIYLVNFVFKSGPPPCNVCNEFGLGWSCP